MRSFLLCIMLAPALLRGQIITTIAGNGTAGYSGDAGAATNAHLNGPGSIATDVAGNIYIADYYNNAIRKVTASGIISTVAGTGAPGYSGDGGVATGALLNNPNGVILDASNNIYFCDYSNHCVRKVSTSGIITTIAGTGMSGYNGDNIAATAAQLSYPVGLAFDAAHNLYIADANNQRIRKVNGSGVISTVAGNGTDGYSGDGMPATNAMLNNPFDIALDAAGNMFIGDQTNNCIRKVNTAGVISTYAGSLASGYSGDGGAATAAKFNNPTQVWVDTGGNLLVADRYNNCVRKIKTSGIVYTVAGTGVAGYSGDGGPATAALAHEVPGVCGDTHGSFYIADFGNNRVRKVTNPKLTTPLVSGVTENVQIYPNPAKTMLTVTSETQPIGEITITGLTGQVVYRQTPATNRLQVTLDIADLPQGIYMLCIGGREMTKWVKE